MSQLPKHKVFISYHHANDQEYKDILLRANDKFDIFIDGSVDTGDIDDDLDDETIRETIRDEHLSDTSVTIVLVGTETRNRKHVDWEIYSSMYDGKVNKKSGILVVNLPTVQNTFSVAAHGSVEKEIVYPAETTWITIEDRAEYEKRFPYAPARIIDNLIKPDSKVSVTNWDAFKNDVNKLKLLIDLTFNDRVTANYDLTRKMKRSDS